MNTQDEEFFDKFSDLVSVAKTAVLETAAQPAALTPAEIIGGLIQQLEPLKEDTRIKIVRAVVAYFGIGEDVS